MRLLSVAAALAVLVLGQPGPAAAMWQRPAAKETPWDPDMPLTGHALPCENGFIKNYFECENVELLSYIPRDSLGRSTGFDVWGWHDSTTGREYVLVGGWATAFVDVTDPVNPKYLGKLEPARGLEGHAAQSVKVYKNHAFVTYESADHGMQVFDLTQLRDVKNAPAEFQETVHYDGFTSAHTITLNQETGFAYINGTNTCGGGSHIVDVRTPTKPTFVGCYTETKIGIPVRAGYVHDAQCVVYRGPDKRYAGREICVNLAETAIGIADVTDKKNPKTISVVKYPNSGYVHQGWFTEDQRYFFVDDEGDENAMENRRTRTIGFDFTALDDPVLMTEFFNTTPDTDHNLYIRGHRMYQGNYGAGLRVLDLADPKNLKQVGFLTNVGEAWGTYPYFKDDVVALSTDTGLYLVRLLAR